jgi:hypothetical protein
MGDGLTAIASKLVKITTVAQYHEAMGIANKDGAAICKHMKFDQTGPHSRRWPMALNKHLGKPGQTACDAKKPGP